MLKLPPIVTTDWLEDHLDSPNLVIIDIRSRNEYREGHIPGSINLPFDPLKSAWTIIRDDLLLEIPSPEELFQTIGDAGISREESVVVIVNKVDTTFNRADVARVAVELIYAGIDNVAILDGGYNKWIKEGRRISTETTQPISRQYVGEVREHIFVPKHYVLERIGKSVIVDARDPDVYFGITTEPWGPIPGHIPTAKNLPTPWIWTPEGMYRPIDVIDRMVQGVIGTDKNREIIVYCGVGGYSSVLWYVLTQILSYTNVKIYDGGWQEWLKEPQGPISVYKWE
ncbi:MAG: rhodanese-like domain-containing protein [Ignisphaera sp.]|uniref:Sulfurtransferase n=1 Tax=Ignisphaera aggregans TaxID=334771 RepID=A0A7J3N0I8_9CREN